MVHFDKLFVMTPQGDLRVLLDEGDPQQVDALERQFFASHVTEDVWFATGRPRNGTLDGQCSVRRTRPADRLSPAAVSLAGYAGSVGRWFGREPRIRFLPWEEWRSLFSEKDANITWDHIARSPNCSIRKA
jgi:hypothetical protein